MRPNQVQVAIPFLFVALPLACSFAAGCAGSRGAAAPATISRDQVRGDIAAAPGLTVAALGVVAVATFTISGDARIETERGSEVVHKTHEDTFEATDAFVRELLAGGVTLVPRGRSEVDARLAELEHAASGFVNDDTAPSIGNELGAQTLIVGAFEFNAEADGAAGGDALFLSPKRVFLQTVHIKGFDITSGKSLFDLRFTLGEEVAAGRLLARSLSRFAGKRLLEKLGVANAAAAAAPANGEAAPASEPAQL